MKAYKDKLSGLPAKCSEYAGFEFAMNIAIILRFMEHFVGL